MYVKAKPNLNSRFVKVGLRIFRSLSAAESYCTTHNLDASAIEYGDSPELKEKVREIARVQEAVLEGVLEALNDALDKKDAKVDRLRKELERKENHTPREFLDFVRDSYMDRIHEIYEQYGGLCEALWIVTDMSVEMGELIHWKG